jgi:flavin prenyltransferase
MPPCSQSQQVDGLSAPRRLIVGISGASGIIYGVRLLEVLKGLRIETHLVVSTPGEMTRDLETDVASADLKALATFTYKPSDFSAAIASGSFPTMGMIVAPCSARTVAEVAYGTTTNLLTRAADVCLKERRRLVLMLRETPFSLVHLRAMLRATEAGAIIAPPIPAFYPKPKTLEEMVDHTIGRVLDLFGIENERAYRWGEHDDKGGEK